MGRSQPVVQETWVQFLGPEDPLEKGMATHSSILAWRIPRTWNSSSSKRSLVGCSPWHSKDTTEDKEKDHSHYFILNHCKKKSQGSILINTLRPNVSLSILSCLVAKSCLTLGIPWTVAHQAPLAMEFPRQGYWSGLPFLTQGANWNLSCLLPCQVDSFLLCLLGSTLLLSLKIEM